MSVNSQPPPRAPRGLGARGRTFWKRIHVDIEFSDAETELLVEACRTLDHLNTLDESIKEHGAMIPGSQGQLVVNPAVTEVRQQKLVLHRLLSALNIPEEDAPLSAKSVAATHAARTRWGGGRVG